MKKISIAEFIGSLSDGGADTLIKDYARLIDKDKFDISVIAIRENAVSANTSNIINAGVRIIYIYNKWNLLIRLWNKIMGFWYIPFKVYSILKENRVQVLHVHLALLRYVRRIGKRLSGIKLFYTCHNVPQLMFGDKRKQEKKAAEYLIKNCGMKMIALHEEMKKSIDELFQIKNTVVIRNGVDLNRFKNMHFTKEEIRYKLHISQEAFIVGHVGRFAKQKNHDFLLEVFREIASIKDNAFLLMIGDGDTKQIVEKLRKYGLEKKYLILSHRSDVNVLMRAMDVFVFPSIYEGLPVALIEAQVSGLRCVTSKAINEEAFISKKTLSLDLDSPKEWADTILNANIVYESKRSIEEYDMNREIKRLERLYIE